MTLILPKTSGDGIKVDSGTPTFGWRDITGSIRPDPAGTDAPALANWTAVGCRAYAYAANDKIDMDFHIPHDYVPGTDLFVHVHWGHAGTAISGSFVATLYYTYAKGHNQANFITGKSQTVTVSTPNIATVPQFRHRVDEVQLSDNGGTGNYLDTAQIEVDGMIIMTLVMTTIPSITGATGTVSGASNDPYIFTVDLHYQSTNIATKAKAPNFYT